MDMENGVQGAVDSIHRSIYGALQSAERGEPSFAWLKSQGSGSIGQGSLTAQDVQSSLQMSDTDVSTITIGRILLCVGMGSRG